MKILTYIIVTLAITACATAGQTGLLDFNAQFNQSIPTNPQYRIDFAGVNRYQIVIYQGGPLLSERMTRASFLTRAGFIAMEAHCLKLNSKLEEHSLQDHVDSWGFINVLGYFTCRPLKAESKPNVPKSEI